MSAFNAPVLRCAIMALILPLAGCSLAIWPFERETAARPDHQAPVTDTPVTDTPVTDTPLPVTSGATVAEKIPTGPEHIIPAPPPPVTPVRKRPEKMPLPARKTANVPPPLPLPDVPQSRFILPPVKTAGGYHVQLASYRRQGEAERGWRRLKAAYPAVLGRHKPRIRQAEVPEQGVFYRLSVSGFDDVGQSVALCDALMNAGGDCIVKEPG